MSVVDRTMLSPADVHPGIRPRTGFYICAALLVGLASSVYLTAHVLGGYLEKAPVSLHKPLPQLDKSKLGAYRVIDALILPDEMIEALGTHEYIQWVLEDPRRPQGDPLRYPVLFVTYYTGGRTQVPHTPERCHLGAGWAAIDSSTLAFPIVAPDGASHPVEAMSLRFNKAGLIDEQKRTVTYTFYANCAFTYDRNTIRMRVGDPRKARAFFSKVEVSFASADASSAGPERAKVEQATVELLQTVLPVLVEDHWPSSDELLERSSDVAASQPSSN